jgi:hypothetical protein
MLASDLQPAKEETDKPDPSETVQMKLKEEVKALQ